MLVQFSEIMLGCTQNQSARSALWSLLMLAKEMRADRALSIDRDGNMRYCVEDSRYETLEEELSVLLSQIPNNLPSHTKELATKYLKSLYQSDDVTIITK